MSLLLASLAAFAPAWADSITLDTGATIEGDLARYQLGGDCQLSVTEGPLTGVIVIVPCHRVQSFMRTAIRTPVPIGLEEEAVRASEELGSLPVVAGDSASAGVPVQASVLEQPVEAVRTETRAVSFGQGAGAVEVPMALVEERGSADVEEEPFYDEPLFPRDPTEPIGVADSPAPAASHSPSHSSSAASAAAEAPPQRSAAPAPIEPTGPRMAPRMDDPTQPAVQRSISF
ncbi:MAG: hypothetical protein Q8P18_13160 [Pseudomonadota bacterium]|nr:hypothetical protein [Pseudomonadota bacterium]